MTSYAEKETTATTSATEQWWYLEGTGFNVRKQIEMLLRDEDIETWLKKTKQDLLGFWLEYLCKSPVLPIRLERRTINGKTDIMAPSYGNVPLLDTVSSNERYGAVRTSIGKIVDFLKTAPPDSMAAMISPPGWTGLKMSNGQAIEYPDTQIYLFRINEINHLEAVTIQADLSIEENETIARILSGDQFGKTEQADLKGRIIQLVRNPIFLENFTFEEILRLIEQIKGSPCLFEDKTFFEAYRLLKERSSLLKTDEATQATIRDFENFVLKINELSEESVLIISEQLGKTVLKINYTKMHGIISPNRLALLTLQEYRESLNYVRSLGGCNGGGARSFSFASAVFGPRTVTGEKGRRLHCGKCGKHGEFSEGESCPYDSSSQN